MGTNTVNCPFNTPFLKKMKNRHLIDFLSFTCVKYQVNNYKQKSNLQPILNQFYPVYSYINESKIQAAWPSNRNL